jgi:hypothetical protein
MDEKEGEELSLADAVTHLLEECRMILPGVQALLGFQLIAVFSSAFSERLSPAEQRLHLLALALLAIAGALVMAPAAYHRQTQPQRVSKRFLLLGGRLLLIALVPLTLAIALNFYLITRVILGDPTISLLLAAGLGSMFGALWFVWPRLSRRSAHRNTRRT